MKKVKETLVENNVEVTKTGKELLAEAIAALTPEQLALIYPPIERANFVVRKSWFGRNQIITFVNNKNQRVTYNHDEVDIITKDNERYFITSFMHDKNGIIHDGNNVGFKALDKKGKQVEVMYGDIKGAEY